MTYEKQIAGVNLALRRTKLESLEEVIKTLTLLQTIRETLYAETPDEDKVAALLEQLLIGS